MLASVARQVCVVTILALAPIAAAQSWREGGYADRGSVPQGGTITFHISTSISPFSVEIVNLARPTQVLTTITGRTSTVSDCAGLWENGCGWAPTAQLTIPSNWPSGYYAARFPTSGGTRNSIFIVRAANPGLSSQIVVVAPTNTWQAYNQFGGKSVYDSISSGGKRAHIVSMKRPYYDNLGLARYPAWEQHFVNWMAAENRAFEVITDDDLADPNILGNYRLVLLVGHSEYWSLLARQNLEAYSRAGGNVAVFSGNTMWWQSRVNLETRQFTVYKAANLDPMTGVDNDVVTVNWFDWPVFNPENFILGASFRHGGYANVVEGSTEALPVEQRTPFTVVEPSDWAFNGTGLLDGSTFGRAAAGNEVDGAVFNTFPNGDLLVDGSDGTPLNFKILATVPGQEGYGVIGYYVNENGGVMFNVATRDWLRGLAVDATVQQITRNVLDRLSLVDPLPYVPRTSPWLTEELFNTPIPLPGVVEGWRGDLREASVSAQCAQEGPFGLRLEGADWTQLIRNFTPDNVALTSAQITFQVNLDALTASPSFTMPVVELIDNQNDDITIYAAVEMAVRSGAKSIRLSLYNAAGTRTATTAWVVLSSGWHNVTVTWSSPGSGILEIDGTIRHELANPTGGQQVREIMLEFAGSGFGATGAICLDAMRLRNPRNPVASPARSTISASPTSIVANGTSTSTITVQLKDATGTNVTEGGDTVTLATTRGSLSAVIDNDDGTYTATLTSSNTTGTATISGTVNGAAMTSTATVTFTTVGATSLDLVAPSSTDPDAPFDVTVTARDANGNVATSYAGTVQFSSNDGAAVLPASYTFQPADNGVRTFSITLRTAGARSLTVSDGSLTDSANVKVKASTTTSVASSLNPAHPGQQVTFTATVTSATAGTITGNVTFRDGSTVLGTVALSSGSASLSRSNLASGSHSMTATYNGDANYVNSTSSALAQVITLPPPPGVNAVTNSTANVNLSWAAVANAASYRIERSFNGGPFVVIATVATTSTHDPTVTANTTYLYRVSSVNGGGHAGLPSALDPATTKIFTADPQRLMRASHVNELRTTINAFRASAGLAAATYSRPTISVGMKVQHTDITEMRTAVNAALSALGLPAFAFTDTLTAGSVIKWQHWRELQSAIAAIPAP